VSGDTNEFALLCVDCTEEKEFKKKSKLNGRDRKD
jgi:hypothetical protein